MRNGLSMAMVCMVNNTAIKEAHANNTSRWLNETSDDSCPVLESAKVGYEVLRGPV